MPILSRLDWRTFATACAIFAGFALIEAPPASAEIKTVMMKRLGKFHPLFLPQLPTPAGWSLDQAASDFYKLSMLLPTGSDFHSAEARIFGRADNNTDQTTIESYARTNNDKWLSNGMNRSIDRLADVARDKGGPAFQLFRYTYPSNAGPIAEIVAFGEDTDTQGNLYDVQIVLSARGDKGLADHKDGFLTVLKGY